MSCIDVMLQCFDSQSRCIFILSTMFQIDSKIAREILGIILENYCHKSSRSREKKSDYYFKQTKG